MQESYLLFERIAHICGRGSSLSRVSNGGVHCELVFSVSIITGNLFQHVRRVHTCSRQRWKSSAFLIEFSPPGLAHRRLKKAAVYCPKHQNVVDCLAGTEWLYTKEVATMCCIHLIYNWHRSVSWLRGLVFLVPGPCADKPESSHPASLSIICFYTKHLNKNIIFISFWSQISRFPSISGQSFRTRCNVQCLILVVLLWCFTVLYLYSGLQKCKLKVWLVQLNTSVSSSHTKRVGSRRERNISKTRNKSKALCQLKQIMQSGKNGRGEIDEMGRVSAGTELEKN